MVTGKDGQTKELVLRQAADGEGHYIGQADGRVFVVPAQAAKKLLADVTMTIGK